ncbi:glycerophosphoryl diester phosphodiesterase membrane domain-containing protein [Arthrobacter sp. PO-11]|uniref:Glycerophosphoryl diester phosphodiesterase membrane domain-containing protein n=2 Tax=Arthrobacter cavernae TaxID=2817681 RepID=A0A939HG21_9MICC|nr:glycerophosphoryl diester phosphodiesterase membrane domain-containing protein [Arthrobacter cavernae]
MFGSALIFQVISTGLVGVISMMTLGLAGRIPYMDPESMDELLGPLLGIVMAGLGAAVLSAFLGSVLQGVMVVPVSRSVLNRRTGFKQMWTLTGSRIWPLLGVAALLTFGSLLAGAAFVGLSALLLVALGPAGLVLVFLLGLGVLVAFLWMAMRLLVAPAVVVVEEAGVYESLLRSWRLTKNNWWRIFGIVVVIVLMIGLISNIVQIPLSLAAGGIASVVSPHGGEEAFTSTSIILTIVSLVVTALIGAVGFAYQSSANALIYFDLRMRRDGLDVELLRLLESGAEADGIPGRRPSTSSRGASWPNGNGSWPGTPPGQGHPTA